MAIQADRAPNYGGTAVTQKYSPLHNVGYKSEDSTVYNALLTNRVNLLSSAGVLPQVLYLCTDWDTILTVASGTPPLVVISSNRANWIAGGVGAAIKQQRQIAFSGPNDLNALTAKDGQTQSPPLYVPQRTIGDRRAFILVHTLEYKHYRDALAGTGLTVVGWAFKTPTGHNPLAGFGASRYAAIEFCKYLRANKAGTKFDYAWVLDDNVVALTGFPGYELVETAIAAGTTVRICAGFEGGAGVRGQDKIQAWAKAEIAERRGKPTELKPPTASGIIQQVVLWNIKYLTENKLNFGPIFVTSGEDVSLGNYLDSQGLTYLFYGSNSVYKEDVKLPDYDRERGGPLPEYAKGAKKVAEALESYAKLFAEEEEKAAVPPRTPPPPVQIKPKDPTDGDVQTLGTFITSWFSTEGKAPKLVNAASAAVRIKARCQAVEQLVCGAIKANLVSEKALTSTFKINGDKSQVVKRVPPPPEG